MISNVKAEEELILELAEKAYNIYAKKLGYNYNYDNFKSLDNKFKDAWILVVSEIMYESVLKYMEETNETGKLFKYNPIILKDGRIKIDA